ncbi:MAG: glycosyltransferase family 39 protein [Terriglobales bacterium]
MTGPGHSQESRTQSAPVGLASSFERHTEAFLCTHARPIVIGLCVYAAIRILVFAAAFPLFNITDEASHFLAIRMYAEWHWPGKELPAVDPAFEATYVLYGSPEYTHSQQDIDRNGPRVPLCQVPPQARDAALRQTFYVQKFKDWSQKPNFEAQSPPLYYVVAAGWYKLGAALGIGGWGLVYWVRFLNSIAYALLVWLSYRFVRNVYPDSAFLFLAVPALIAVFPQDVFFGMNRDVLSAPLAAAALLLLIKAADSGPSGNWSLVLGSLLVGLAMLVEVSNCVLYGALAATFWFCLRRSGTRQPLKIWVLSASVLAALAPPSFWILRNYSVIGDWTGSGAKMHELGWTVKPLADIWHHPLFSADGLSYFLLQLTRSFWHGEYLWHGHWMRLAAADWFYVFSSALMVIVFTLAFTLRHTALSPLQRLTGFHALFLLGSSVLFLAAISLLFDFHDCLIPSRARPFFINGRIISGALLPFVLIYASGLELVANHFRKWIHPTILLLLLLSLITASEVVVRKPAFRSSYNFFALSARGCSSSTPRLPAAE